MGEKNARAARVNISEAAVLIDEDGNEIAVTIVDISADGFRLNCIEQLEVGERVTLRGSRFGDLQAEIRWASPSEAGGVFLTPASFS